MSKLAKDMTLGEVVEHCKSFKGSCDGCDFMNKLGRDSCCNLKLSLPEFWDIENIEVNFKKQEDLTNDKKIS